MNRPKRKAFVKKYGCEHTERYIQALETYSHYLEKALNKACEELSSLDYENEMRKNPFAYTCEHKDADQWKEWAMNDD